jgi:hypothetical protein
MELIDRGDAEAGNDGKQPEQRQLAPRRLNRGASRALDSSNHA